MSNQSKHKRSRYTIEFKQDEEKLVNEKVIRTNEQSSISLSFSAIGQWVRAEQGPTITSATKKMVLNLTDRDELIRLRKVRKVF